MGSLSLLCSRIRTNCSTLRAVQGRKAGLCEGAAAWRLLLWAAVKCTPGEMPVCVLVKRLLRQCHLEGGIFPPAAPLPCLKGCGLGAESQVQNMYLCGATMTEWAETDFHKSTDKDLEQLGWWSVDSRKWLYSLKWVLLIRRYFLFATRDCRREGDGSKKPQSRYFQSHFLNIFCLKEKKILNQEQKTYNEYIKTSKGVFCGNEGNHLHGSWITRT